MDKINVAKSLPDYEEWKGGIESVARLPTPRLVIVMTILGLVGLGWIAAKYTGSIVAICMIATMLLGFGITAFYLVLRREDRKQEDESAESSDKSETG